MTPIALSARLASAELELEAKGFTAAQAQAAVRRALASATSGAGRLRPAIRDAATEDLLELELAGAEPWLRGVREAAARGDYRRGMERAARDGRYADGMERLLGAPTSRDAAWRASHAEAAAAWERQS